MLKVVFDDDIDMPAHFVKIMADKVILQLRNSNELVVMNRDLVEISRHKGSEDIQGSWCLLGDHCSLDYTTGNKKLIWHRGRHLSSVFDIEHDTAKNIKDFWKEPIKGKNLKPDIMVSNQSANKFVGLAQDSGELMDNEYILYKDRKRAECIDCGRYFQTLETWECLESSLHSKVFFVGGDFEGNGIICSITFDQHLKVETSRKVTSKDNRCKIVKGLRRIPGTDHLLAAGNDGVHAYKYENSQFVYIRSFYLKDIGEVKSIQIAANVIYLLDTKGCIFMRVYDKCLPTAKLIEREQIVGDVGNINIAIQMNVSNFVNNFSNMLSSTNSPISREEYDGISLTPRMDGVFDLAKMMASQSSMDIRAAMKQSTIMNMSPNSGLPSSMVQSMMADEDLFKNNIDQCTIKTVNVGDEVSYCLFVASNDDDLVVATDKGMIDVVIGKVQGYSKLDFHEVGLLQSIFESETQLFLQRTADRAMHLYSKIGQRVMKKMPGSERFDSMAVSAKFRVKQSVDIQDMLIWYAGGFETRIVDPDTLEVTQVNELLSFADVSTMMLHQIVMISKPKKILALVTVNKVQFMISSYDVAKKKERVFEVNTVADEKKTKKAERIHFISSSE